MRTGILVALLLSVLFEPAAAQGKKKITEAEYSKWGELSGERLSPDARWIAFTMDYAVGNDTLFLQEVRTGKRIAIPNGTDYSFTPDSRWFLHKNGTKLSVRNLDGKIGETFTDVKKHSFDGATGTLAVLTGARLALFGNQQKMIINDSVFDFAFRPKGGLAIATPAGIKVSVKAVSTPELRIPGNGRIFSRLVWDPSSTRIAFLTTDKTSKTGAGMYDFAVNQLQYLNSADTMTTDFAVRPDRQPFFSADGERFFLYVNSKKKPIVTDDTRVQVWEASNGLDYAEQREYKSASLPATIGFLGPSGQQPETSGNRFAACRKAVARV